MGKRNARQEILDTFRGMVLSRAYDEISVQDVIEGASVARSTFYDHYRDKRALLLTSMAPLLNTLAHCAAGTASRAEIDALVCHMWDNRTFGRTILSSNASRLIVLALADTIKDACDLTMIECNALAHGYMGSIIAWLSGDVSASHEEVVSWLVRSGPVTNQAST